MKRPPPFYPRNMLIGLVTTVAMLAVAVTGLTVVLFTQNTSLTHLSAAVQRNNADRRHDIDALMRSAEAQQAADAARYRAELQEIRRLRILVRHLGGNPGPACCDARPAPATSRSSARPALSPSPSQSSSPAPSPSPSPTHSPRPSPSPSSSLCPVICGADHRVGVRP